MREPSLFQILFQFRWREVTKLPMAWTNVEKRKHHKPIWAFAGIWREGSYPLPDLRFRYVPLDSF